MQNMIDKNYEVYYKTGKKRMPSYFSKRSCNVLPILLYPFVLEQEIHIEISYFKVVMGSILL